MIKGSVQQEHITIINISAPNTGAPTYVKQILTELKEKIEYNAFVVKRIQHTIHSKGQIHQTENK